MRWAAVAILLAGMVLMGAPRHHRRVQERVAVAEVVQPEVAQEVAPARESSGAVVPEASRRAEARRQGRSPGPTSIALLCALYGIALLLSLFFGMRRELRMRAS